ncbi:MAG: hypothetical protein ACD_31C00005G0043 [uncultured bacterium]|uniref:Glycosyl transferase family 39 n=3 Tax=Candidatus Daviesiibacteriota TaxID=1752718 RepID=A0A0G0EUM1_9BACT|nr:MAG: hypothetical protein ACD_31C00005G0043 [uncultured bacterium]KKQ10618.1 MAG: Glycosyl transferase family 39 [Candidatus Daviesbacteria bacterium GW2011_GWB1_36_5]KKQ15749.1 MAG: Glycosyl transferase family 39 [Candidatus Daviesbacteria bacterium GW2011_GWA1_36_8]OGE17834.1 MAG: hypothetical protein A2858_03765 [Candidatus Daviesbacteria bacterium RIFCSPHIGHO2_01_FULL_36_37]
MITHLFWRLTSLIKKYPEVIIVFFVGAFLRLGSVYPGYYAHGDEIMYGEAVKMVSQFRLTLDQQYLGYPPLVPWIMALFYIVFFIPAQMILTLIQLILSNQDIGLIFQEDFFKKFIFGVNWEHPLYWARYSTAFFGSTSILLTYILALRVFSSRIIATAAAFLVAVNYRLVLNSTIGFIDIYNTFFTLLSVIFILRLLEKQNFKNYLLAFIMVSLSFITKYQFYSIIALIITQVIISFKNSKGLNLLFIKRFLDKNFISTGILAFIFVLVVHTQYLINWEFVVGFNQYEALKYGIGTNKLNIYPISYLYHKAINPYLSILFVIGLIVGINKKEYKDKFIIFSSIFFVFSFLYFYHSKGGFYTRNFLAVIPLILMVAAFGLETLVKFIKFTYIRNLFIVILILLFSKDHLEDSLIVFKIQRQPSYKVTAEEWLTQNLPANITFANFPTNPIPKREDIMLSSLPDISEAFSYRELRTENIDYSILDFFVANQSYVWWMKVPFEIGRYFWEKPDNLLAQSFYSLAIRELLWEHSVKNYLPHWQVYGYNYSVIDLINYPIYDQEVEIVKEFGFENGEWKKLVYFDLYNNYLDYSQDGRTLGGSLVIKPLPKQVQKKVVPGGLRWESEPFEITPEILVKIEGWMKYDQEVFKNERNGFLRLDFYNDIPIQKVTARPIISFVSERAYGDLGWKKVEIEAVAPKNAKYFTVGFQSDKVIENLYLDDVKIYKSLDKVKDESIIHITIDDKDLFPPNDQGFL